MCALSLVYVVCGYVGVNHRASCILGKHVNNGTTGPVLILQFLSVLVNIFGNTFVTLEKMLFQAFSDLMLHVKLKPVANIKRTH